MKSKAFEYYLMVFLRIFVLWKLLEKFNKLFLEDFILIKLQGGKFTKIKFSFYSSASRQTSPKVIDLPVKKNNLKKSLA